MYYRRDKVWRAQKIGLVWPHRHWRKLMEEARPLNVLFVCSQNRWRSPTAEQIWRKVADVSVRSAGTSRNARRSLKLEDIRWADLILVMEDKHKARICAEFRGDVTHKAIHVLDIPDEYKFMDPELIQIIQEQSEPLIFGALEKA